jgi:hypothetical protein
MAASSTRQLSPRVSDAGRPAARRSLTIRRVARYFWVPVPFRWLASLLTLLALVLQPVGAYASSGVKTEVRCCCPSPEVCKCHDHDGRGEPSTELGRCSGAERVVNPELISSTVPEAPIVSAVVTPALEIEFIVFELFDVVGPAPEKPPF